MEKFKIIRTSTTHWRGTTTIEADTLAEAIEQAEQLEDDEWTDDSEGDGGYSYKEDMTHFSVAYAGERTNIHSNDRVSALYQAQQDYNKPPTKRLLDWKDSEHTAESWDVMAIE